MAENEKVIPGKTPDPKAVKSPVIQSQKPKFDWSSLNTLSVVSLASAISGVGSLVAVITGHISLAQLKTSGENGRKLALVGVVLGYVQLASILLFSVLALVAQVAILSNLGNDPQMWFQFEDMRNGMRFNWD
jgi:hypothetical protein